MASEASNKHVFISYVRENSDQVDQLCAVLEAVNIPYWRDRTHLGPGDEWKAKIREAIRSGSMVFLACFSTESGARDRSYMNEEVILAAEEWRLYPPGRTWLIPVRFDDCPVPEHDLGAGVDYRLHDLRHFFASGLIAAGCDVVTVQRALGHASATVTLQTYAHLWPDANDRTRKAAGELFAASIDSAADPLRNESQ